MISPTYPHYIPIAIIYLWYSHDRTSPGSLDPNGNVRSSKSPTPMDRDTEMQVLLSAQSLNKALQRESLGTTKCQREKHGK